MLISLLLFLPVLFALIVLFLPLRMVRPVALVLGVFEFILSCGLLTAFDKTTPALQFVEKVAWVPRLGINYFVGIDGLSLWLVILTTFLTPIVILASMESVQKRVAGFHAALFLLQTAMMGSFVAMDAVLFYTFFELSLVPMYFMIGIWGGERRIYATVKFFIYTMAGSLLMLLAIIYLMYASKELPSGQMSADVSPQGASQTV